MEFLKTVPVLIDVIRNKNITAYDNIVPAVWFHDELLAIKWAFPVEFFNNFINKIVDNHKGPELIR